MNESEMLQDDEISLFDLWKKLRDGRVYILGTSIAGLLVAATAVFIMPPKYEAATLIQVGQVNNVAVEPAPQSVERMKMPSFQFRVAKAIGDAQWQRRLLEFTNESTKDMVVRSVKATSTLGANSLIEVKAFSASKALAAQKAEAVVAGLVKVHDGLAQPMISKMRNDLSIAREKLARAEKDFEQLGKLVADVSVKDDRFTQLSLITSVRLQKEADVFSQRQTILALETALMAPATQPAKAIEVVFVSDKPVSPKKGLLLALGLIGGLFLGVMWVFFADGWRRARQGMPA